MEFSSHSNNKVGQLDAARWLAESSAESKEQLDALTRWAAEVFGTEYVSISLFKREKNVSIAVYGGEYAEFSGENSCCADVKPTNDVLCVLDTSRAHRLLSAPLGEDDNGFRFCSEAPLKLSDGTKIGVFSVRSKTPRDKFTDTERHQIRMFAREASQLLERFYQAEEESPAGTKAGWRFNLNEGANVIGTEKALLSLIEGSYAPMALIRSGGQIAGWSSRWEDVAWPLVEASKQQDFVAIAEHVEGWGAAFEKCKNQVRSNCEDTSITYSADDIHYFDWAMRPWVDEAGAVMGAFLSMRNKNEVVQARKGLEELNELIVAVLGNIKEGIVACDRNGRLNLFNDSARRMHGLDMADIPLSEFGEFYDLYESDGETALTKDRTPLVRALQGEHVRDAEIVIAPKTRPKLDVVTQAQPLYRADGTLIGAVATLTDVTESKRAMEQLQQSEIRSRQIAFHDALTGLANRMAFKQYCTHTEKSAIDIPTAVLFVDIDDFKMINDTLGHEVGDGVLKSVATTLLENGGSDTFIARVGGDEFVVITEVNDEQSAHEFASKLSDVLNQTVSIHDQSVTIGCSIGLACAPDHGTRIMELVRHADLAMYQAKSSGGSTPVMFRPAFALEATRRRTLENELKSSIKNNQLELYFQPIMCGQSKAVIGAEALVRWNHPTRGMVNPGEFIRIAEESGFMVELGAWVLKTALNEMRDEPELFVSVNLSPAQFQDDNLAKDILAIVKESGFDPRRLELEVTESLLVKDADIALATIEAFKKNGIRVALDDFGTGYSSLSYINHFPFDKIKIDRSFVKEIGSNRKSEAIIECLMTLAQSLGMAITAEGVETEVHERFLEKTGCHSLQGFRYSKPISKGEFSAFMARNRSTQVFSE